MNKYIGENRLTYLWGKIKAFVSNAISGKVDKVSSSTDNAVVRFDGTSGNIQNSGVTINDSNHLTAAKLITSGGTSSQFIKGDGSLDSNTYAGAQTSGGAANKAVSIPFGQVDSTSTSTAFTATVDGITELRDGVCVYLKNGVVTSATNCTLDVNGLGAKPIYSSQAATTRVTSTFNINYTDLFVYNSSRVEGGCWDLFYGYNSDTNTRGYETLEYYSGSKKVKTACQRYQILLTCMDGHLLPVYSGTYTTGTSKTLTTEKFNPNGQVYYYAVTGVLEAGASPANGVLFTQAAYNMADLRYSFNTGTTLTAGNDVYLVCVPQDDGSAVLHTSPIAFSLPSTEDGLIYKRLGKVYDTYRIVLEQDKPCYYYKNGSINLWTGTGTQTDVSKSTESNVIDIGEYDLMKINEVKGKSLVMNQFVSAFDNTWLSGNNTRTLSENIFTLIPTSSRVSIYEKVGTAKTVYNTHKYYCTVSLKANAKIERAVLFSYYNEQFGVNSGYTTNIGTSWTRVSIIGNARTNNTKARGCLILTGCSTSDEISIKDYFVVDLTQMFGVGNEPTTVEEVEAILGNDYYEYNTGEVVGNNVEKLDVYDTNDTKKGSLALNLTELTGKVNGEGTSVIIFPDGLHGVGTAYDSLIVDDDGYARRAVKRMGSVDLGSLSWSYTSNANTPYFSTPREALNMNRAEVNCISAQYSFVSEFWTIANNDMCYYAGNTQFNIANSSYTSAADFKAAMDGVMFYYKLATPIEYVLDTPVQCVAKVYPNGTVKQVPVMPDSTPMVMDVTYLRDNALYATKEYVNDAIADKADAATTLAGYGITDAKIESGVITLGSNSVTPITSHQDISSKANKSEMSVVAGTGTDADKTTITLKSGTSATVLTAHQDISWKQNALTFDSTPTANSTNPVTSGGVKTVLDSMESTIGNLQSLYEALTQSSLVVVPSADWPLASLSQNTIYRVQGTTSYTDYMYDGTNTIPMAEYDNGIDDVPTVGSDNFVKSGGIYNATKIVRTIDVSQFEVKTSYYLQISSGQWKNITAGTTIHKVTFVPIKPYHTYKVENNYQAAILSNCNYYLNTSATFCDGYQTTSTGDGERTYYTRGNGNENFYFTAPSDARFLYVVLETATETFNVNVSELDTIKDEVTEIKEELRDNVQYKQVDLSSLTTTTKTIDTTSYRWGNTNKSSSVFVPLSKGRYYKVCNHTVASKVSILRSSTYDNNETNVNFADGYPPFINLAVGDEFIFKARESDVSLFVQLHNGTNATNVEVFSGTLKRDYMEEIDPLITKTRDITLTEEKQSYTPVAGKYISAETGEVVDSSSTSNAYAVFNVSGVKRVRFLGVLQSVSANFSSGYAFCDANDNVISSYAWDKGTQTATTTKEYIIDVPNGATSFKTMVANNNSFLTDFADDFYLYNRQGDSITEMINNSSPSHSTDVASKERTRIVSRTIARSIANALRPITIPTDSNGIEIIQTRQQLYAQQKAEEASSIQWTPKREIPHRSGVYEAGTTVTGLPYSSVKELDKFIGFQVSIHTFMTAVNNPYSLLYTENVLETSSSSVWGKTYHGTNCATYYGTVCSSFSSYALGFECDYPTTWHAWLADYPMRIAEIYPQTAQGLQVGDIYYRQTGATSDTSANHNRLITRLTRDANGDVTEVQWTESTGTYIRKSSRTAASFDALVISEDATIYRSIELYKNTFTPSIYYDVETHQNLTVTYNNDICTFAGDKATYHEGELVVLNYNLTDSPSHTWTGVEVYKDDVLVDTYTLASIDQSSLPEGQRNHALNLGTTLTYGKYKARMTDGTNYSEYTRWEVLQTNVTLTKNGDGTFRMSWTSANGTPVCFTVCAQSGGQSAKDVFTDEEIAKGYADRDLIALRMEQTGSAFSSDRYFKIGFKGEYGGTSNEPFAIDELLN